MAFSLSALSKTAARRPAATSAGPAGSSLEPPPAARLPSHEDLLRRLVSEAEVIIEDAVAEAMTQARKEVRTRLRRHLQIVLPEVLQELLQGLRPPGRHAERTVRAPMDKTYDPRAIEQRWYESWKTRGYFAPRGTGTPYCIMIPPPNVTGTLHMGHAFQDTIMDALIRYHRMQGHPTLWQAGTDHAGIATQMVVERKLAEEGLSRTQLGREAFEQRVWETAHRSHPRQDAGAWGS